MLKTILNVLLYMVVAVMKVTSLQCYACDNSNAAACGPNFKAYQFDARPCPEDEEGLTYKCGKQVQPPLEDGWVGVIRSCYSTGSLLGLNATNGCQQYHYQRDNFTALYCFCDTDNCNLSPPLVVNFATIISIATMPLVAYYYQFRL